MQTTANRAMKGITSRVDNCLSGNLQHHVSRRELLIVQSKISLLMWTKVLRGMHNISVSSNHDLVLRDIFLVKLGYRGRDRMVYCYTYQ